MKQCKTESHPENSLRSMYSVLYTTDFPTCKPLTKACFLGSSPDNISMIFPLKLGRFLPSFFLLKPQGKRQADLEAECLLSESKNLHLQKAINLAIESP